MAKTLRKRLTDAEKILWKHLRTKQIEGCKFRRQEPVGKYIADFVCYEKGLIIEADGGQHSEEREKDSKRDEWFESQGLTVLRFWNHEVLTNIQGVLEVIREHLLKPPSPDPSHQGRGTNLEGSHQVRGTNLEDSFQRRGLIAVSTEMSEEPKK